MSNEHELEKALRRALRAIHGGLSDALEAVESDVKASVSVAGGGTPAPPGSPPRLQSGELASSIKAESSGSQDRSVLVPSMPNIGNFL